MSKSKKTLDIGKIVQKSANQRIHVRDQSGSVHSSTVAKQMHRALFVSAINKGQPKAINAIVKRIHAYLPDHQPDHKDDSPAYVRVDIDVDCIKRWKAQEYLSPSEPDDPRMLSHEVLLKAYAAEQKALASDDKGSQAAN